MIFQPADVINGSLTAVFHRLGHKQVAAIDKFDGAEIIVQQDSEEPKMVDDDEPNMVNSGKSQRVIVDGLPFSIEIYRLETDKTWTLEVVDHEGTSHVWDDLFESDKVARNTAIAAIQSEGALAFMRGDNVIPFRKS